MSPLNAQFLETFRNSYRAFKNLSHFFYRGLKTSDRLMANVHPVMARLRPAGQRSFNGATMIQIRQIVFIIDSKANCCWIADCGLRIAD